MRWVSTTYSSSSWWRCWNAPSWMLVIMLLLRYSFFSWPSLEKAMLLMVTRRLLDRSLQKIKTQELITFFYIIDYSYYFCYCFWLMHMKLLQSNKHIFVNHVLCVIKKRHRFSLSFHWQRYKWFDCLNKTWSIIRHWSLPIKTRSPLSSLQRWLHPS